MDISQKTALVNDMHWTFFLFKWDKQEIWDLVNTLSDNQRGLYWYYEKTNNEAKKSLIYSFLRQYGS